MKRIFLAAAAAAIILMPATACDTAAHADTTDDAYISVLHDEGITGSRSSLIRMGRAVCTLRGEGWTSMDVADEIVARNDDMTLSDAAYLVGAAQAAYCPEYTS